MTAVGTMGEAGQLFTVYEKNWHCPECNQENYATRMRCFRCKSKKPESEDQNNFVQNPALVAVQAGKEIEWQEAIDPASYQIYYYNKVTGATQWERPVELGPAPIATGWFGRGGSGSSAKLYADQNARFLMRPARRQKEYLDPKKYHTEGATEYNIWYGKYVSESWDKGINKDKALDRCNLEQDAGFTRADGILVPHKKQEKHFFCLHFARGMCTKGAECKYYHRIPTPEDDAVCDELFDCFGRPRHSKHKDDMSGTGSFLKPCRTLFVGNLLKHKYETTKDMEDCLWKHFSEWGELENINVIWRLSICFPRYRLRTSAEFAKEAMSNQSLDQGEILMVRWAHDDPNPIAQDSIQRADKDALAALMRAKGIRLEAGPFDHPNGYEVPEPKRLRLENGGFVDPAIQYPETEAQYGGVQAEGTNSAQDVPQPSEGEIAQAVTAAASSWSAHIDDDSGATYYFNEQTGESTWTRPAEMTS